MTLVNLTARTALALALAAAFPAWAQSNDELLKELKALRERVEQLERKLAEPPAPKPAQPGQWGMTPEQARELSRVTVKTEALQDNFADQGFKGLKISGQIDPSFIVNRNTDESGFVFLNNGDARYTYDNSFFGMAVIDFEKETESGARWKLTLAPERGNGALTDGSVIHEATVSIALTDLQTRLWLGQIPDWTGYEYTLPKDNKLITHNLLFDTMAPLSYTGAALDITRGKWWTRVGLANVNAARNSSGNKTPALVYRVDYSKGEYSGWGFTGLHGKIANFAADSSYLVDTGTVDANGDPVFEESGFDSAGQNTVTHLLEVDGYFIRGDWSLFGQLSYGSQKGAAIFNSDGVLRNAQWWGLSAMAGYKLTPRLEGLLRADLVKNTRNGGGLLGYSFDDGINGIGRGFNSDGSFAKAEDVGTNRYALSAGLNYLYDENTVLKLELRHDGASQPVFEVNRTGGYSKRNNLLGASVVLSF